MNEDINKHFKDYADKYFNKHLELYPNHAVALGLHEYDGISEDVSLSGIEKEKATLESLYEDLQQIEYDRLLVENKFDYDIIKWSIESTLFEISEIGAYKRNPMTYAMMFMNMGNYLYREYAPFEERLKSVMNIMKDIPDAIENAKINLNKSVPKIFCKYAKRFTSGYEDFFKNEIMDEIEAKEIDETLVEKYKELCKTTVTAFNEYINYIDDVLIPNSNDDFRLGKEKFEKMLNVKEHINFSIPELKKLGEAELERLETQYAEVAKGKSNIEKFVDDHPTEDNLIKETDDTLHELIKFVNEKNIVNIPDNLNCIVKEMPHYMKVGFAAMATAGPFEKSDESFYFVGLPDKHFNEQKRKEWMTLFNYPTLKLISIHEAFPGHYTHFLNSNLHASKISKLSMSYTYTEGWAHYTEEMMIDEGYGNGDYQIKLAQIIEAIVRCCRYLAAIGLHYEDMTIDEATELFKNHAKLSTTTATQEAERGAFDPGYLSYTLGKIMLKKLKKDFFSIYNGKHSLKDFHNKIVSLGAPTYRIASKYLLNNSFK